MAVKVVQRKPVGKQVAFGEILIGEMFAIDGELFIKMDSGIARRIRTAGHDHTSSDTRIIGHGVSCTEVDVNIEWCVAGSI